jgi:hypothetical protein
MKVVSAGSTPGREWLHKAQGCLYSPSDPMDCSGCKLQSLSWQNLILGCDLMFYALAISKLVFGMPVECLAAFYNVMYLPASAAEMYRPRVG